MPIHPVGVLVPSIAVLLIVAAGICVMVGAGKLAARLFLIAIGLVVLLPIAFGVLGSIRYQFAHSTDGAFAGNVALAFIVLGSLVAGWFALWLKGIHAIHEWTSSHFDRETGAQAAGTFLTNWFRSVFSIAAFAGIAVVILAMLFV